MNSFNIKRFCLTFRWMLVTHFQTFLAFTAGCAAAVFLLELILIALNGHADVISEFCVIFLIIYALVAISTLFSYYLKKPQREVFLMLPSTNLEKFLAAVLYATVVWTLTGFLAFALGDTLRMVVRALVYGNEWYSLVPRVLEMFGRMRPAFGAVGSIVLPTTSYKVVLIIWYVGCISWIHSLYIFGGTLMRKYSFVVSSLVIILCTLFLVWLGHKFDLQIFYVDTIVDGRSVLNTEEVNLEVLEMASNKKALILHKVGVLGYVVAVLLPLLSIFNYWASFHIFKGFQLITNKWFNYDILKR